MNIIKVLKWAGRALAILSAVLALVIGLSGNWGDAIYALILAGAIWYWTDILVARMVRTREANQRSQTTGDK